MIAALKTITFALLNDSHSNTIHLHKNLDLIFGTELWI